MWHPPLQAHVLSLISLMQETANICIKGSIWCFMLVIELHANFGLLCYLYCSLRLEERVQTFAVQVVR